MVVDTSAIIAILQKEPEARAFAEVVEDAVICLISAVSVLEAAIFVQARRHAEGVHRLDALIREADMEIVPFDSDQMLIAREGFRRFGKGRHPAALNFGDCAAYALARAIGEPLLFKGDDFSQTDVSVCVAAKR